MSYQSSALPRMRCTLIEELELRQLLSVTVQNLNVRTPDVTTNGVSVNGIFYFPGRPSNSVYDEELWRSDGTPQGTYRVKDIYPGTKSSSPIELTNVNGTLYFEATDGAGYPCLFKSDGTDSGTIMVHRFTYLRDGVPDLFCASGDRLFFTAVDPLYGRELWVSDGTDAGTHMVRDLQPGTTGSDPGYLYAFDNKIFFLANGANGIGDEPFVSDGTYDGTFLLKDIDPGGANGYPNWWHEAGGKVFFSARTPETGFELWVTDGTPAGTNLVKDIIPGSAGSGVHPVIDYNGFLYSIVNPMNSSQQLWKTDPATGATTLVKDSIGGVNAPAYAVSVVGGKMIFTGEDASHGDELWVSDGTSAGTHRLTDINPGTGNGASDPNVVANGWDFFVGNDESHGNELWATDGATTAGTFMVADALPGSSGSDPFYVTVAGNNAFFMPLTGTNPTDIYERGLWVATATAPPTPPPSTGASLSGTVYNDANNNGKRDSGETGVAGITVYNDANNNVKLDPGELTTVTDANGAYTFTGLSSGPYKIRQILQSGWTQTTPANNYGWTINLSMNQQLTGRDFGTRQSSTTGGGASISGTVFNDADGDGVKDSTEAGVAAITVYNDSNNNGKLDSGELTTVTDGSGNYQLVGLASGNYKIREILQSGWIQTTPAKNYGWTISLSTNQILTARDFGTHDTTSGGGGGGGTTGGASISGAVFDDLNGNGVRDAGDSGVGGVTVYNDANNNYIMESSEIRTTTDASGIYTFTGLSGANYKIRQILQTGWSQTTPAKGYGWTISLSTNQTLTGRDFGTKQNDIAPPPTTGASIAGVVYNDANANAKQDAGELGIAGVMLYNDANNNVKLDAGELTTVTDGNGAYHFTGLASGSYKIRQILQSGWAQTTPANNYGWTISLSTDQNLSGKNFGTKQSGVNPPPSTGSISGITFNDNNENGQFDAGDVKTSGKTVFLDTNNNGKLDSREQSIASDSNGNWSFTGLLEGTYHVRRVFPSGWTYSTTLIDLTLNAGDNDSGLLIGSKAV